MAPETAVESAPETMEAPIPAAPAPAKKKEPKAKASKKDAKGKDSKKYPEDSDSQADGPNVAAHPRAARAVARSKSWAGLIGFMLGGYLSLPTNTLAAAGLRALLAGVVCYVAAWAGAVFLWRRLVILEVKSREQQLIAGTQTARARRELPPASAEGSNTRIAS